MHLFYWISMGRVRRPPSEIAGGTPRSTARRPQVQSAGQCRPLVKGTSVIAGLKGSAAFFALLAGRSKGEQNRDLRAFCVNRPQARSSSFLSTKTSLKSTLRDLPRPTRAQARKNQREYFASFSRRKSTAMEMSASGDSPTSRSMVKKPSKPAACSAGR